MEFVEKARLKGVLEPVEVLMDTGAYHNYISATLVASNNLWHLLTPVQEERVELGGTGKTVPILGRITLDTTLGNHSARVIYNVFDSQRELIMGLETLALHFVEALQGRLTNLRQKLLINGKRNPLFPASIHASVQIYPREPGNHVVDLASTQTHLNIREECLMADGVVVEAPEEGNAGSELKELFAVPRTNREGYVSKIKNMIDPGLYQNATAESMKNMRQVEQYFASEECIKAYTYERWTGITVEPIVIEMIPEAPPYVHSRVRHINKMLYMPAQNSLMNFAADNYLVPDNDCPYTSAIVVVPKPKNPEEPRICGDYKAINDLLVRKPIALVDPKKLLDDFRTYKYFCETDWLKSFHQIPIDLASQRMLSIVTPFGCFRPQFLPEGVQPASGILAHVVRTIFGDLHRICIAAQDNLLIGGNTIPELLENVKTVIRRCNKYNVILSAAKTKFGLREAPFFGYILGNGVYKINPERQAAIARIEFPKNKKELHSFLGMCLFVSPFIASYSEKTANLTGLLNSKVTWNTDEIRAQYTQDFERLKLAVAQAVEVGLPDMEAEWTLRVDASDVACGAVLLQRIQLHGQWQLQPIAFVSHKFSAEATRWSVLEKELYGLVFALQKLDYYLRLKHFVAETDHSNILYMQQSLIPKLVRWKLFIQSYLMTVRHIPGKCNVIADALSRLYNIVWTKRDGPQISVLNALGPTYADQACTDFAENYAINPGEERGPGPAGDKGDPQDPVIESAWKECHCRARGHRGAKRTYLEFGRRYPEVRVPFDWVQARVDACPLCQKFKADLGIALKTARHVLVADNHRSQISIDVCGMEKDERGNCVCFVIVNHNTKLTYLHPAPSKEESETIKAVLGYIGTYGLVDKIVSDEGGEFSGSFTKELMSKLGVRWELTITERPQAHGTERTVGRVLDAVRLFLSAEKAGLSWSDPAVLATTAYLLNSERNEETGFSAFDLTFGKDEMTELPDISGVQGKPVLQGYIEGLQRHLDMVRAKANETRIARQKQRTEANVPPGDHRYSPKDLVFIRRNSLLRESKFTARNQGPFEVIAQTEDGEVRLRNLLDESELRRHHNALRIFEGSRQEAVVLAQIDANEQLVANIDDYAGSVYLRSATTWAVTWHDHTLTWENYKTVEKCKQLTDYASTKPYLKHRFGQSGVEFNAWCARVNKLSYDMLVTQAEGFFPVVDQKCRQPFALAIQYFDHSNELQGITSKPGVRDPVVHMLQSAHWNSYLTAYLIRATQARYEVFVPSLSGAKTFKKFPARGAYYKPMMASELLQFARALPTINTRANFCADETIGLTDFRERVWPEQWDLAKATRAAMKRKVLETEQEEQAEIDEGLERGEYTGRWGVFRAQGKTHRIQLDKIFPDGDYLCIFPDTNSESKVAFKRILLDPIHLLTRRGEGQ